MMDEPFSALDVLTAENLRGELLELWASGQFPTRAVVLVTHNIEEAVLMADRVVVLGSRPGTLKATFEVPLDRPRDRGAAEFGALIDAIYQTMTGREKDTAARPPGRPGAGTNGGEPAKRTLAGTPLPGASVDGLAGLAEILAQHGNRCDLADLADELGLEVDDLLPLVDALELLGFALVRDGDLMLTPTGCAFAGADVQASKKIFAQAALNAPLVHLITTSLQRAGEGSLRAGYFPDLHAPHYTSEQVAQQLETATDWGRYAELYSYDAGPEEYRLDEAAHRLAARREQSPA
jgi:NitT/TauT family transport system ATP-binding protein